MAYTVVFDNGSAELEFQIQPTFEPSYDYEWNERDDPVTLKAIVETWTLRGCTHASADEEEVTDAFEEVVEFFADRTLPVTSVEFRRDGTAVYSISTATHRTVEIRQVKPSPVGPGSWANHITFDIVVAGRKTVADGDSIVALEQRLTREYDASGLETITLDGRVETSSGTSALTVARTLGLAEPGSAYGLMTNGEGSVNVTVLDYPADTKATFSSSWKEHGVTLPTGVEDYSFSTEEVTSGTERTITTVARGKGSSLASIRAMFTSAKPSTGLAEDRRHEDQARLEGTSTFVQRQAGDQSASRLGNAAWTQATRSFTVTGGGREAREYEVPGAEPIIIVGPARAFRIVENVEIRARGVNPELRLPEPLFPNRMQPSSSFVPPARVAVGITPDADEWRTSATREYLVPRAELVVDFPSTPFVPAVIDPAIIQSVSHQ